MLKIDGIPPRLTEQLCEQLICQQYWHQGKLVQEVDILFLKVNGHWHQLYFDAGRVFWRIQKVAPVQVEQLAGDTFSYPLINIGEKYALQNCIISDCITESLGEGVRITLIFEDRGSLLVTYSDDNTRLQFIKS